MVLFSRKRIATVRSGNNQLQNEGRTKNEYWKRNESDGCGGVGDVCSGVRVWRVCPAGRERGPPKGDFIQHFDKDGDGKVSKQEFTGPDAHFSRLDKNGDGYVDASEKPTGPPKGNPIQHLDKDGDGKLSKAEFPGPDDHFDRFDKDGDGFLSESEAPKGPPPGRGGPQQGGLRQGGSPFDKDV